MSGFHTDTYMYTNRYIYKHTYNTHERQRERRESERELISRDGSILRNGISKKSRNTKKIMFNTIFIPISKIFTHEY